MRCKEHMLTLGINRHKTPNQSPASHPKATSAKAKCKARRRGTRTLLNTSFLCSQALELECRKGSGGCAYTEKLSGGGVMWLGGSEGEGTGKGWRGRERLVQRYCCFFVLVEN
jgi:hypothetical protein